MNMEKIQKVQSCPSAATIGLKNRVTTKAIVQLKQAEQRGNMLTYVMYRNGLKMGLRLREFISEVNTKVVSNSRNKIHQTLGPLFSPTLYEEECGKGQRHPSLTQRSGLVEKIMFLISFVFCLIQQVLTGDCSGALLDLRAHELGGHEPGDGPEPHREEEDEDGEAHQREELELLGRRRVSVLQVEENACEGMNLLSKESHPIYSNLLKFYPRRPPRWP